VAIHNCQSSDRHRLAPLTFEAMLAGTLDRPGQPSGNAQNQEEQVETN